MSLMLVVLALVTNVKADIPAHCQQDKHVGEWTMHISEVEFIPSLSNPQTTCGHGFPNHIENKEGNHQFSFVAARQVKVTFGKDFKTYQNGIAVGTWTGVYDEGFIAYVGDQVFTGHSKYYKLNGKFQSDCDKTMISWYIKDKNHKHKDWSCFYGIKNSVKTATSFLEIDETEKTEQVSLLEVKAKANDLINQQYEDQQHIVDELNNSNLSWSAGIHEDFKGMSLLELNNHPSIGIKRQYYEPQTTPNSVLLETLKKQNSRSFMQVGEHTHLKLKSKIRITDSILDTEAYSSSFVDEDMSVDDLSKVGTKAKSDSDIDIDAELGTDVMSESSSKNKNKNLIDDYSKKDFITKLNSAGDGKKEADSKEVKDIKITQKYLNTKIEEMDKDALPTNWDWRNVGGLNYVTHPRLQKSCGSCYIFATLSSLEARLRIKTNLKDKQTFSRQFIISCSIYTEGCRGGYPVLVGKFANEFELAPEECMTYQASNDVQCSSRCNLNQYKKKYTVKSYGYLGGRYGATGEIEMMKEIRARGPIPGNIRVPWSFSYYKKGIYSEHGLKKNAGHLTNVSVMDRGLNWEKVDHSTLIVGWGEENGVKYWICMNTWGHHWGEEGFYRIARGTNEVSIESMVDIFDIEVKDRNAY